MNDRLDTVIRGSLARHATAAPTPRPSPLPTTRDVSAFPENHFASPTGNLRCALRPAGELGEAHVFRELPATFAAEVPPAAEVCGGFDDMPVAGVRLGTEGPAQWACSGDRQVFPYRATASGFDVGAEFTAWWDEGFGSLVEVPGDGGTDTLAVLPYDRALTADGITCTIALDGVTCTNEATGHSFHLNRAGVTLK
mgnify:FL=1